VKPESGSGGRKENTPRLKYKHTSVEMGSKNSRKTVWGAGARVRKDDAESEKKYGRNNRGMQKLKTLNQ
jgi:hypothetical protein